MKRSPQLDRYKRLVGEHAASYLLRLQNVGYSGQQGLHFEWFFNQVSLGSELQRVIDFTRGRCCAEYQR